MDISAPLKEARYGVVAIWFHWIIAALIVLNLILGLYHEDFSRETRASMMYFHKATGITILALSLGRLFWRFGHRPPAFDPAMHAWEVTLARITHGLFYVLMIVIPLTGWAVVSGKGAPVDIFGLFNIPALPVTRTEEAHELFEEVHEILGKAMIGLIALHVAGALKHHFEGHRHLIGRMAPWLYRQP